MTETKRLDIGTSLVGWLWLLIAPILIGMALISTVRSETTYWVQIFVFSLVSIAGAIAGISTGLRYRWGARVLLILSWLGFAYFAGCGLLAAIYSVSADNSVLIGIFFAGLLGAPGIVFAGLAITLRSGLRASEEPPNNLFKPNPLRGSA